MSQLTEDDMLKIVMLLDMSTFDIPAPSAGRHRFRPALRRFLTAAYRVRPDLLGVMLDEVGGAKKFFESQEREYLYKLYDQFAAWVDTYLKDAHS
jgi:hypothetical protein